MRSLTHRRRLLAGLVFTGLLPMRALAQTSTSTTPAPPLPDCVLDKVQLSPGVALSASLGSDGTLGVFYLFFEVPKAGVRLTGVKQTDAKPVSFALTCKLNPDAVDKVDVQQLSYYLPGLALTNDTDFFLGASTMRSGRYSFTQTVVGFGKGGATLYYTPPGPLGDLALLVEQMRAATAMTFTGLGKEGQGGQIVVTYTPPRLSTVFTAARARLDKLIEDNKKGLCKLPAAGMTYPAKFCTTAAVDVMGLTRDCWELKALHGFRDWVRADPRRAVIARRYNEQAPDAVRAIAQRPDAHRVWLNFYWTGVLPAATLARLGFNRPALWFYHAVCKRLVRLSGAR